MTDRPSCLQYSFRGEAHAAWGPGPVERNLPEIIVQIAAPLRTLRAPSAHSHFLRGPALLIESNTISHFILK